MDVRSKWLIRRMSDDTYFNADTKLFGAIGVATQYNSEFLARKEISRNTDIGVGEYQPEYVVIKT